MNGPTYEGFIAFIHEQPRDRKIDHYTWRKCAFGDYLDERGEGYYLGAEELVYEGNPTLAIFLGNAIPNDAPDTYGGLSDYIKDNA